MAEISVDAQSGFLTIRSRHKLDVNQSKVMGAVAILLVEPPSNTNESSTSTYSKGINSTFTSTRGTQKDVINITDPLARDTGCSSFVVPSSASLISSPCGWMGRETAASSLSAPIQEHTLSKNGFSNKDSPQSNRTGTRHDRDWNPEPAQYNQPSIDDSTHTLYNQNRKKPTTNKSHNEDSVPTRNVSVIDLTNVQQSKQISNASTSATSGDTFRKQPSTSTFPRPVREPRTSTNSRFAQFNHPPRVSSPFLSRMNSQLQRRKHRNIKISKMIQQPVSQRMNIAKCCACGDVLTSFADNQTHSIRHNLHNQCVVCGIKLPVTSNLRRHFFGHIHHVAFTCPFCPAMYRRKDNLTSHLFQKHNINSMQRRSQQMLARMDKVPKQDQEGDGTRKSSASLHDLSDPQQSVTDREVQPTSPMPADATDTSALSTTTTASDSVMQHQMDTSDSSCSQQPEERQPYPEPESGQSDSCPIEIKEEPEGHFNNNVVQIPTQTVLGDKQSESDQTDNVALHSDGTPHQANMQDDGSLYRSSGSILNYSCSACDVKFSELEKLHHHVATFHSDEVSTSGTGEEANANMGNGFTITPTTSSEGHGDSLEGQTMYLYSDTSRSDMIDQAIRSATNNRRDQVEEVIDIENLGDMSNYQQTDFATNHQDGISFKSREDMLSKSSEFLGPAYQSMFPPPYESSQSNSMYQGFNMDSSSTGSCGRNRISKGNNKCSVCGVSMTTWEAILEHGDQHSGMLPTDLGAGRRFPCVVCKTVLSTKDSLRRHAINHMGVQHFCTMCSAVYSRRDNLLKHMRDTHGVHSPRT